MTTFSVETIANTAAALFNYRSAADRAFREDNDISPYVIGSRTRYMPWGADDQMPYDVHRIIEDDETIARCMEHNFRNTYGAGLRFNGEQASPETQTAVGDFLDHQNLSAYYMGCCKDIKEFGFCVTVIRLTREEHPVIAAVSRLEAMYCRFGCNAKGKPDGTLYYGNFRLSAPQESELQRYTILSENDPIGDLQNRLYPIDPARRPTQERRFVIISRMPTTDSTFYPIPEYAAVIRGKWYDIKRLIAIAKYSKLKNAAPLKYLVEFTPDFWQKKFDAAGATDEAEQQKIVNDFKTEIIDYLTGVENTGKVLFSEYMVDPDGHENHDIKITNLETRKEGGDWETDIQEALNMICFSMGVHSNLVGSVPGKSGMNNSGSDKRELYTIAQSLEQPTRDILLHPLRGICRFNGWAGVTVECPIIQLTTLDQHRDAEEAAPAE